MTKYILVFVLLLAALLLENRTNEIKPYIKDYDRIVRQRLKYWRKDGRK